MHRNEKRNDGQQTQLTHETDEKINLSARVIDVLQQPRGSDAVELVVERLEVQAELVPAVGP